MNTFIKTPPLVSVITITRNRSHLISGAINSVLIQTYSNFEYIIVNGASTDNTVKTVKSFYDPRIKLINLANNLPIPQTISIGINATKGKYITFLDDDDEYLPTKIEKQVALIESLPEDYGFVYCWMDYYDKESGEVIKEHHTKLRGSVLSEVIDRPTVSGTPTLFFKSEALNKLGGWRSDIGIISDWELAARACKYYKVDYVPEVLVKVYVNHGISRMSQPSYYLKDFYKNAIIFHTFFLSEFSDIFQKHPKKKALHVKSLMRNYLLIGELRKGFDNYFTLLSINFNLRNAILPFYYIGLRIVNAIQHAKQMFTWLF